MYILYCIYIFEIQRKIDVASRVVTVQNVTSKWEIQLFNIDSDDFKQRKTVEISGKFEIYCKPVQRNLLKTETSLMGEFSARLGGKVSKWRLLPFEYTPEVKIHQKGWNGSMKTVSTGNGSDVMSYRPTGLCKGLSNFFKPVQKIWINITAQFCWTQLWTGSSEKYNKQNRVWCGWFYSDWELW